jgi:hypothetical protein
VPGGALDALQATFHDVILGRAERFVRSGDEPLLVAESWCRVVGGSGQRHEVSPAGATLPEEGFV